MPGGVINGDDHLGSDACRIGAGNIPEMPDKGCLESLLFTASRLRLAMGGLVEQPGRQLSRHQIERGKTVDQVLIIPGPYQRPMALHPQGNMEGRYERKPRLILTQQHTRSRLRFFLTPPTL